MTADSRLRRVSIVVPCYNYGRFLSDCIASATSQRMVDTKILVIDDASPDGSADEAIRLAEQHPNVEVRVHSENVGHIGTYNEGLLDWADGDYVMLLSADDVLAPGALARAVGLMEMDSSVGMTYGWAEPFFSLEELATTASSNVKTRVLDGPSWLAKRCREGANVVSTPSVLVRQKVQGAVGGYNPSLPHAADFEMWLRIAAVSNLGHISGVPQAYYRLHEGSMSAGVYRDEIADLKERKAVFDSFFATHGDRLDELHVEPRVTYTSLAREAISTVSRNYEEGFVDAESEAARIALAKELVPDISQLRAYRAYRRRKALGPEFCSRTQLFIGATAGRRVKSELWWWRMKRFGG
jgi:glycosyltransferase involved in cell wall biosynthesis